MKKLSLFAASSLLFCLGNAGKAEAVSLMGTPQNMGNGSIHVWADLEDDLSKPISIGVSFTADALDNLPMESDPAPPGVWKGQLIDGSGNYTFEWELLFPQEVLELTPFNHMGFNWNPHGHGPMGIYDLGHFDIHFYMITPEERYTITGFEPNISASPNAGFLPSEFFGPPAAVEPRMGQHWLDPSSPELQPPPNNQLFTQTWIYGTYEGDVMFWEPMVTEEFFRSNPNENYSISLPTYYAQEGYYPTTYSVNSNTIDNTYSVSLNNFVFRQATIVPEASSVVSLVIFGALGMSSLVVSKGKKDQN